MLGFGCIPADLEVALDEWLRMAQIRLTLKSIQVLVVRQAGDLFVFELIGHLEIPLQRRAVVITHGVCGVAFACAEVGLLLGRGLPLARGRFGWFPRRMGRSDLEHLSREELIETARWIEG